MLTITEHDAAWLERVGIAQRPTRGALVLSAARHVVATAAWVAVAAALIVVFWAGAATVLAPPLAWLADGFAAGVHVVIVWVEGVLSSW